MWRRRSAEVVLKGFDDDSRYSAIHRLLKTKLHRSAGYPAIPARLG
jgi:hypothetical protein